MRSPKVTIPPDASDAETEARDRVAEIKSFFSHLAVFTLVHLMMVGIYLLSGGGHFWPLYSLFGWGIGLASHAASTFGIFGMYDKAWEERKVRELMLQSEHGLNADEVRALLKKEMASERRVLPSTDEMRRMRERLENLEAIVTSRDWDELPTHTGVLRKEPGYEREDTGSDHSGQARAETSERKGAELDESARKRDPAADAARLAKRVR